LSGRFSDNISSLEEISWDKINYAALLASVVLYILFFLIKVTNWWHILNLLGNSVPHSFAAGIWFGSQKIKYIPGKVWFLLARFYLSRKRISKSTILVATGIELTMMLLSALLTFLIFGIYYSYEGFTPSPALLIALVSLFLVLIHPRILEWGLSLLARVAGEKTEHLDIRYRPLIILLFVYLMNWLLFGLANYLLVTAFTQIPFSQIYRICGLFAIAYVIGFLSFITPGGLGVRESVQVYFLSDFMSPAMAVIVAVFSRLFWMFTEVLGTAIFLGIHNLVQIKRASIEAESDDE
jgi:uncharacterized membrane protein YbhN (UPF0104 family)